MAHGYGGYGSGGYGSGHGAYDGSGGANDFGGDAYSGERVDHGSRGGRSRGRGARASRGGRGNHGGGGGDGSRGDHGDGGGGGGDHGDGGGGDDADGGEACSVALDTSDRPARAQGLCHSLQHLGVCMAHEVGSGCPYSHACCPLYGTEAGCPARTRCPLAHVADFEPGSATLVGFGCGALRLPFPVRAPRQGLFASAKTPLQKVCASHIRARTLELMKLHREAAPAPPARAFNAAVPPLFALALPLAVEPGYYFALAATHAPACAHDCRALREGLALLSGAGFLVRPCGAVLPRPWRMLRRNRHDAYRQPPDLLVKGLLAHAAAGAAEDGARLHTVFTGVPAEAGEVRLLALLVERECATAPRGGVALHGTALHGGCLHGTGARATVSRAGVCGAPEHVFACFLQGRGIDAQWRARAQGGPWVVAGVTHSGCGALAPDRNGLVAAPVGHYGRPGGAGRSAGAEAAPRFRVCDGPQRKEFALLGGGGGGGGGGGAGELGGLRSAGLGLSHEGEEAAAAAAGPGGALQGAGGAGAWTDAPEWEGSGAGGEGAWAGGDAEASGGQAGAWH